MDPTPIRNFFHSLHSFSLPPEKKVGRARRKQQGFTLIEIMAVITIMVIIMAVAIPVVPGVIKSSKLRNAANALVDYLTLARQTAMTRNCRVEVRFYQVAQPDGSKAYSSFRAFTISNDGTAAAMSKVRELSKPMIISELPLQNTIFRISPYTGTESLPLSGTTSYYKFSFLPNGRTDFDPGQNWFMTIFEKTTTSSSGQLPANYVVMQVDDFTGHIRLYRP